MRKGVCISSLSLLALLAPSARADTPPNIWDLAKNQSAFEQRNQHVLVERDMDLVNELMGDPQDVAKLQTLLSLDRARTLMDGVTGPKDVWLRYDEAWLLMKRDQWGRAIPIFEEVAKAMDHEAFSQEVWERLAECYVRMERTQDEIRAYDEVLERATNDLERITPLLNQGEAYMRAGDADAAVVQFRQVLRLSATQVNTNAIDMLAQWDLAVALDRSGDGRTGLEAARTAVRMDRRYIGVVNGAAVLMSVPDPRITFFVVPPGLYAISEENTEVYFVPKYERDWYLAMGYEARALDADSPSKSLADWRDAETHMMTYVSEATRHAVETSHTDVWLDLGRKRLDEIRKRRGDAQQRAGKVVADPNGMLPL